MDPTLTWVGGSSCCLQSRILPTICPGLVLHAVRDGKRFQAVTYLLQDVPCFTWTLQQLCDGVMAVFAGTPVSAAAAAASSVLLVLLDLPAEAAAAQALQHKQLRQRLRQDQQQWGLQQQQHQSS